MPSFHYCTTTYYMMPSFKNLCNPIASLGLINFFIFDFQNLINKERKIDTNGRGNSESTSGCDSGQNYESDDNFSSKSASQQPSACSSENLAASTHSEAEDSGNQSIKTSTNHSPYVMQTCMPGRVPLNSNETQPGMLTSFCLSQDVNRYCPS